MHLCKNLQRRLSDYNIELLSLENLDKYSEVFYCNNDYYLITDGRPASKDDCIDVACRAKYKKLPRKTQKPRPKLPINDI